MSQDIVTELWRNIDGYINYQVSNIGRVRNSETGRILKGHYNRAGYNQLDLCKEGVRQRHAIHRLVAQEFLDNPENKPFVDHIDGNKQNNIVNNLRWVTNNENGMNSKKQMRNTTSIYKGVCWYRAYNKWRVQIKLNQKQMHIGYYDNEKDAAHAYNEKALELFGEFSKLNVIED